MSHVSARIRRNVYGLVAIFIALGGTAYATHPDGRNTISTADLQNLAVTNPKLAPEAVGTGKLVEGAVSQAKLANGAVSELKLTNQAVTTPKLAADSVNSAKVVNDSLGGDDIDETSLDFATLQRRLGGTARPARRSAP